MDSDPVTGRTDDEEEMNEQSKYDDVATFVRQVCDAEAVALLVIGGSKGSGFCIHIHAPDQQGRNIYVRAVADSLRQAAMDMERQLEAAS